jgi:hypothetical protein
MSNVKVQISSEDSNVKSLNPCLLEQKNLQLEFKYLTLLLLHLDFEL